MTDMTLEMTTTNELLVDLSLGVTIGGYVVNGVSIDESGNLIYELSDGSLVNAGNVSGADAEVKATPIDADTLTYTDTQASNVIKKATWANIKAFLKTYFDGVYQAAIAYTTENVANKKTTLADNSDTFYPSQKAVKAAVDAKLSPNGSADNLTFTDPNSYYTTDEVGEALVQLGAQFKATLINESAELGTELLSGTGWTSTGWTGDFATGFTHTAGNTSPLSFPLMSSGMNYYQLEFDVDVALNVGTLTVAVGNSTTYDLYGIGTHVTAGIRSISNGDLVITPVSAYTGKITNITLKQITATTIPTLSILDSLNAAVVEIRSTGNLKENYYNGVLAGRRNTSGVGNAAFGYNVMTENTSGFWNVAIGSYALFNNTVGSRNVAIGRNSLQNNICGLRNVAIGSFALISNTSGNQNIAIGVDSLDKNTTGSNNVSIGKGSAYENLTGFSNVAIGTTALTKNTTGNKNAAVGESSLYANTTGANNVGVGMNSLYGNTTGGENTVIGYGAAGGGSGAITYNTIVGCSAGRLLATGASNNVIIGKAAGDLITTGSSNIIIGTNCDPPLATTSNHLNIGNSIYGDISIAHIGIGVVAPTAVLHLKAGAAGAGTAPLKLTSGVLNTTPEAGAIEFDGTNLYFVNSAGARQTLAVV